MKQKLRKVKTERTVAYIAVGTLLYCYIKK